MQRSQSLQSKVTWTKGTRLANFHQILSKNSTDTKKVALVYCTSSSMQVLNSDSATSNSQSIHRLTWGRQTSIKQVLGHHHFRNLTKTMVPQDQIWWNMSKFQEILTISQVLLKKPLEMPLRHPLTTILTIKATTRSQPQTTCKARVNSQSI